MKKIKILHLEDAGADADFVKRVLQKAKMNIEIMVVDTKETYVAALIEFVPDVILSDHSLPSFNSEEALSIFLHSGLQIPFILVTATMSEEYAVSVIKAGAHDYILKDHLNKLPEAIINAIEKIELAINLENEKTLNIKQKTNAVLVAHEIERSEMGSELLQNINQILAAANLYIDCAISDTDKRTLFMQNSKKYILMAINEIKKISHVIMPPILEEIGLIGSLNDWIEFEHKEMGMNIRTDWKNFDDKTANNKLQLTIYRIVQEQLNNTIKYSAAQNIYISLEQISNSIELIIKDDGVGFDTSKNTIGVGLQNINTRAEIHNGTVLLESELGKGCLLKIVFPI